MKRPTLNDLARRDAIKAIGRATAQAALDEIAKHGPDPDWQAIVVLGYADGLERLQKQLAGAIAIPGTLAKLLQQDLKQGV